MGRQSRVAIPRGHAFPDCAGVSSTVDHVFPDAPLRQKALIVPYELRYLLACRKRKASRIHDSRGRPQRMRCG